MQQPHVNKLFIALFFHFQPKVPTIHSSRIKTWIYHQCL
jgi:hypothetical protein